MDIRHLRIGSHVGYKGKRERVRGLDEDNGLIVRFPAEYVSLSEVKPIVIVPELLNELGFEDKAFAKWHSPSWVKEDENCFIAFEKKPDKKSWKVFCVKDGVDRGFCACRYLHESEAFLSLHNIELIND